METAVIRSTRLELTPLDVADADEMVQVLADPALYEFTGGEPPTHDELRRRYAAQVAGPPAGSAEEWHNWIVRPLPDRTAVGYVQATVTGDRAEIAWVIGTAFQGHGYASEAASAIVVALGEAGVTEVTAHIHPRHHASNGVAERVGLAPTDRFAAGEREWRLDAGGDDRDHPRPLSVV